jgi:Tol biopolymer transport system component
VLLLARDKIVLASVFTIREIRRARAATAKFQQIKLRQLTNGGLVISAAISPDGKFYAFTNSQKGMMSLQLGSVDGQTSIELRGPAPVIYRGLEFAPDGRSIYYVIDSDGRNLLYRLPTLGGVPLKMRDDVAPYFSIAPDNTRLAFLT